MTAYHWLLHMPHQCSQSAGGALAVVRIGSWLSPVGNQANFMTLENYLQGGIKDNSVTQVATAIFVIGFEYPVNNCGLFGWTERNDDCMLVGLNRWIAFTTCLWPDGGCGLVIHRPFIVTTELE